MRIPQIAHLALAAVLLIQSVLAVATVTPTAPLSDLSQQSVLESDSMEPEGRAPCHETPVEIIVESAEDCCASMDESCCESGCAAPGVALPSDTLPLSREQHPPFVVFDSAIHLDNSSAGLFRPPRSIQ